MFLGGIVNHVSRSHNRGGAGVQRQPIFREALLCHRSVIPIERRSQNWSSENETIMHSIPIEDLHTSRTNIRRKATAGLPSPGVLVLCPDVVASRPHALVGALRCGHE